MSKQYTFKTFLQIKEDANPEISHEIAKQLTPIMKDIIKSLIQQGKDMPQIMAILRDAVGQSVILSNSLVPQGDPSDFGQLPDSYEKRQRPF